MSMAKSIEAHMLISVEHGADREVLNDLIKLEGVTEASLVYGEYDAYCRIKVEDIDNLRKVVEKIRNFKVRTTETLIIYEIASKRIKRLTNRKRKQLYHTRTRRH